MAENIENKGFAVYNAKTNGTGDEAMDAKTRKNIEYLIILLISAAVLAVGWSNRKTIAGWGNQNTEDAAEKEDLILEINSVEDYLTFVRSVNKGNTYKGQYVNLNVDLDLAEVVSKRGTCLRRLYGAVIVIRSIVFRESLMEMDII